MTTDQNLEKQMQKQMGCMTGFLHIFDRHQILSGRRHYSAKRLPPSSPVTDTTSGSEKSAPPSPAPSIKSPLRLSVLELKEGSRSPWKFGKETPRLSLDSRATTDAKGGLHPKEIRTTAAAAASTLSTTSEAADDIQQHQRSPSVIARLMGLEPLQPDSSLSEPETKPQLRRSASESRVTRDLFQSRFVAEKPAAQPPQPPLLNNNGAKDNTQMHAFYADPRNYSLKIPHKAEPLKGLPWRVPQHHRKSFFDSGDFFPEPKQTAAMYGEIEHRLRIRGIDETSKDLQTLKQILEALQLKGLLHSGKSPEQNQVRHRNFVYDECSVAVAKPWRPSNSSPINRRNQVRSVHRNYSLAGENSPSVSPRRERNLRSPNRSERSPSPTSSARREGNAIGRRSNSVAKPKPLSVDTRRRKIESADNRRASQDHSPKLNQRRTVPDQTAISRKKTTAEIQQREKTTAGVGAEDESSSISGSSIITTSTDTERSKTEEYKEGRHLLDRCDKLLHSIAEMTAATDMQPSPVSVLDSSFYKDESFTPSPVTTRRNIDFKGQSGETEAYEIWSPPTFLLDGSDFAYVSDILRASRYFQEVQESDVFHLLEKQLQLQGGCNDTSKVSRLQRKLVFDTINEILDRDRRLPPWKVVTLNNQDLTKPSLNRVWSEFERIRKCDPTEDLFDTVCGVLKKDLAGDVVHGWGDCPAEMSEAVLDIERLIFRDLIGESIRDLATLATRNASMMPRRKLVF